MSLQKLNCEIVHSMHIHSYLFGAIGLAEITGEVDDPCKTRKKRLSSECAVPVLSRPV